MLFLHGGPGSGCAPLHRGLLNPGRYRTILLDQRGAGRSLPLGEIRANHTSALLEDLEHIRHTLGIERWWLFGGSWGSLLALRYAQQQPEAVAGLVLRGLFLGSRAEVNAYLQRGGPELAQAVAALPGTDLLSRYAAAVFGPEPQQALLACVAWLNHERALMGEQPLRQPPSPGQWAKVRIQMHYLSRGCFVPEGELLAHVPRLRHLPAALIQGLADPVCPPNTAYALQAAWPELHYYPIPDAGHSGLDPAILSACQTALDRLCAAA